jgi:deaminated glutathione amidase
LNEPKKFRAALVQLRTGRNVIGNIDAAARLVREAKSLGADYVQTPEQTSLMELDRASLFAHIVEEERDPALAAFQELARELKIHLHVGSLAVKVSPEKAANRAFVIDPEGEIAGRYDKIHMFDVDLANGESYRESNTYRPGESAVVVPLPFCKIGLTICYDVRFPALYRAWRKRAPMC